MKKLLTVLIGLVLGMTASTNATISLYVDGAPVDAWAACLIMGSRTIEVYSDDDSAWVGYLILDEYDLTWPGAVELSNPVSFPAAGVFGDIEPYSKDGLGTGYELTTDGFYGIGIEPGIQHSADFVSRGGGISFISLWDAALGFDAPVDYFFMYHDGAPDPNEHRVFAEADGPYEIGPGQTITLSGRHTMSTDWIDEMRWSIGGQYVGDAEMLPVSYEMLVDELGLGLGVYQVELLAGGYYGVDYDYTTIEIIPEPATLLLLGLGGLFLHRRRPIF